MTRRDLIAGARQWLFIDGAKDGLLLAWYVLLAATAVIVGAPIWLALVLLVPPVVGSGISIWRQGLANREAREFYEWVNAHGAPLAAWERELLAEEREQLPETD